MPPSTWAHEDVELFLRFLLDASVLPTLFPHWAQSGRDLRQKIESDVWSGTRSSICLCSQHFPALSTEWEGPKTKTWRWGVVRKHLMGRWPHEERRTHPPRVSCLINQERRTLRNAARVDLFLLAGRGAIQYSCIFWRGGIQSRRSCQWSLTQTRHTNTPRAIHATPKAEIFRSNSKKSAGTGVQREHVVVMNCKANDVAWELSQTTWVEEKTKSVCLSLSDQHKHQPAFANITWKIQTVWQQPTMVLFSQWPPGKTCSWSRVKHLLVPPSVDVLSRSPVVAGRWEPISPHSEASWASGNLF